jgi:hypothetical protein
LLGAPTRDENALGVLQNGIPELLIFLLIDTH